VHDSADTRIGFWDPVRGSTC